MGVLSLQEKSHRGLLVSLVAMTAACQAPSCAVCGKCVGVNSAQDEFAARGRCDHCASVHKCKSVRRPEEGKQNRKELVIAQRYRLVIVVIKEALYGKRNINIILPRWKY